MITCHKSALEARCAERGHTLEQVMPCVVKQDGDIWTIDETHATYPRKKIQPPDVEPVPLPPNAPTPADPVPELGGPGTELKALLAFLGFTSNPNCACNARARTMDENEAKEPGWCEANLETILDWLKEQADARGLPFFRAGAKIIVRRAISNAKRKKPAGDSNK